jgi:acetolactate synthase I/II/III large subunit
VKPPTNGARCLLETLAAQGVDTCFANPGTSEMHLVAALDEVPAMQAVLTLFEGVATGAADGYGRIRRRPAATLLHLGPGLANGLANLHNARRARTPVVNLVGDHATYHQRLDAPLQSDIRALAGAVSGWYRSSARPEDVAADAVDAVAAACGPPGQVATLVLPADVSWSEAKADAASPERPAIPSTTPQQPIDAAARALTNGEPACLLLGGSALDTGALETAGRIAAVTGARLVAETFPARIERGAGLVAVDRLAYLPELASAQLAGLRHLVLVDARHPVSFFAYPGQPGDLVPDGCRVEALTRPEEDVAGALAALAERVGASGSQASKVERAAAERPEAPTGALSASAVAAAVGATLPEHAIVVDEANTAGIFAPAATAGCPPHSWLCLTGGAIGQGIPVATGAAVAAPDRPVVSLQADGSAMYTLQGLWTQARQGVDVTTVIIANRSYAILQLELARTGAAPPGGAGPKAQALLDLDRPDIDFAHLARAMGVPAVSVGDGDELTAALRRAFAEPGPHLVEAIVPPSIG